MSEPVPSLRVRALQWLAAREHSRQELRAKLLRVAGEQGGEPDVVASEVDALLDQLEARGQLNTARFVEARVHAREARFGNRRIEYELKQHGLVPDGALREQLKLSELARGREVWRKKFGQPPAGLAERAKQTRFLLARGFSGDVVRTLMSGEHEVEGS